MHRDTPAQEQKLELEQEQKPELELEQDQYSAEQQEPAGKQQPTPESAQVEQQPTAEQQAKMYLDQLQRTQADFVNYRRRISQEQAESRIVAQNALLSKLLPVLDDLERALAAAPPEMLTHPWVQGLLLVARRLKAQLDQLGIHQFGASGEPFDPHKHEAIMTEERTDVPEGTILHIARPGYILGDRVIRPAQVSVASSPSPTSGVAARQEDAEF
ncbi:nucleotide exchange factor GrpE [Ktedonobacteria bacterium brp13]|nr:nucleotide exchange factor GrpE [Ktedonobacteria bacterium brp13]